jgi:hypothetical protein
MTAVHLSFPKTGVVLGLILALHTVDGVKGEDWPQWRGLHRGGAWLETGILKNFPPGGLAIRWRAAIGCGWSSPVVAKGRVYVTDSRLERPNARERVHCFNEETGKQLRTHSDEAGYPHRVSEE